MFEKKNSFFSNTVQNLDTKLFLLHCTINIAVVVFQMLDRQTDRLTVAGTDTWTLDGQSYKWQIYKLCTVALNFLL